ncbi:MAG: succinate dehydrogenase iron-sulfur subunit [Chloroflexi bacterium]|nr:succinate dehydrogenase iron-sulfur subunit [Chloroflexota bacterium]
MQFKFHIQRYDPSSDWAPRFERYLVELDPLATVLDGLHKIQEQQDGSLCFRRSCRSAICGSCAMYINGTHRLACKTIIKSLRTKNIKVGPLPRLTIIKDLAVDMGPFFEKVERIMPYLVANSSPPKGERPQSIEERRAINEMIDCIMCGACYSACPIVGLDKDYLGPAALTKAYRFVGDSRDEGAGERLSLVNNQHGVWRCHTIFNCQKVCPKSINPTWSIQQLKKRLTRRPSWVIFGRKG